MKLTVVEGLPYQVGIAAFDELGADFASNYRAEDEYDVESLYDIILQDGRITDPLVLNIRPNTTEPIIVRGNRRYKVGQKMKVQDAKSFTDIFGQVPVHVYEGLTPIEESELRLDHTGRKSLTKWGIFLAMEDHFLKGRSETDIATSMNPIFKADTSKRPKLLAEAEAETDFQARRQKLKQCWRQRTQTASYVTIFPQKVRDAYELYLRGKVIVKGTPKINSTRIGELYSAREKDKVQNHHVPTKTNPGPLFEEVWKGFIKADGSPKPQTASKKSSKDIEAMHDRCESAIGREAFAMANNKGGDTFQRLDHAAYLSEVVREGDKALWAKVVKVADTLIQKGKAETDKAK